MNNQARSSRSSKTKTAPPALTAFAFIASTMILGIAVMVSASIGV